MEYPSRLAKNHELSPAGPGSQYSTSWKIIKLLKAPSADTESSLLSLCYGRTGFLPVLQGTFLPLRYPRKGGDNFKEDQQWQCNSGTIKTRTDEGSLDCTQHLGAMKQSAS